MTTSLLEQRAFARYSSSASVAPVRGFVFPFSGGGPTVFRTWESLLDGIDVFAAVLPGRDRRMNEAPIDSMSLLVDDLLKGFLKLAERPFILFGHSLGALVAYELACRAQEHGLAPLRLFVSAFRAPGQPRRNRLMHTLSDEDFIAALRRYGGTPPAILDNQELMRFALPVLRSDFRVHECYTGGTRSLLRCPVTALAGTRDQHVSEEEMLGWGEKTLADFRLVRIDGDHFFLNDRRNQVLDVIRRDIAAMHRATL